MILLDVPAGTKTPCQFSILNPGNPDSEIVGTFGKRGDLFRVVTAIALSRPELICGKAGGTPAKKRSTCPPSKSVMAGAPPL